MEKSDFDYGILILGRIFPNFLGPNYRETTVFLFCRNLKIGRKSVFHYVVYLGKGYFFLWTTLPSRGRNMVRRKKRNFGILARKSVLCYRTPINGMFIALGVTVVLAPSDQFLNFTFRSYGCFCGGDLSHAAKSITPPHCRGTWVP